MTRTEPGFAKISKIIPQVAAQYALQINPNLDIKNFRFEANAWVGISKPNKIRHTFWKDA
jgi:hypothetical protein